MKIVATFDPASSSATSFTAANSSANGALVFFNESNISLTLTFADGAQMYLPAWYHRHRCGATGSVNVDWTMYQALSSSSPPISQIIVEAYAAGEHFPADGPLVRQANVGNQVSTVSGNAAAIQNNGNAPGTSIIASTPNDAGSATWTADNSGNLTVKSDNAGVLTTLLQLIAGASPAVKIAAATVLTEALGNLKADGTFESVGAATLDSTLAVTGTSTFTGDATFNGAGNGITVTNNALISGNETVSGTITVTGDATFNGAGTGVAVTNNLAVTGTSSLDNATLTTDGSGNVSKVGTINGAFLDNNGGASKVRLGSSKANAGDVMDVTNTSNFIKAPNGGLVFQSPSGSTKWSRNQENLFSGSGSGTFATGVGGAPSAFAVDPCTVSGSSQTIGLTLAASSVVTTGSGLAWSALASR